MHVLESFRLDGKVAVVTGGAGLYGRQITEALAEAGAKTFMASRNLEQLEQQVDAFRQANLEVSALQLDQSEESSIKQLRRQILDQTDGVDILVNNAVLRAMTSWEEPATNFAKSMEVNATGVFMMMREFGDYMAERGHGSIINIGSIYGMVGPDKWLYEGVSGMGPPDYYFHKGGMIQLTKFAASKLGPHGVRVNVVNPGGYNPEGVSDEFKSRYADRTFLGRMANETDLKGAIVFLASDASAYITGASIPVDAGLTAK
jgi:NAD(P)-dependent dehydrogenase (short-subunit alcohol dehydrogenase family)